jgi:hypothetical protein
MKILCVQIQGKLIKRNGLLDDNDDDEDEFFFF